MAEIFLGYVVNFVNFVFQIAVIAFVASEFGYISISKNKKSEDSNQKEPRQSRQPENSDQLGDVFKNLMGSLGPALKDVMGKQGRVPLTFSDEDGTQTHSVLDDVNVDSASSIPIANIE